MGFHFKMEELKKDIYFLNMGELKKLSRLLNLSEVGKKKDLIQRILIFLETGKVFKARVIPEDSKAKWGVSYPLSSETLILYGNYKNDHATRLFMKTLVGDHFHFTARGQDWIKERWLEGKPPTYAEFAAFWSHQYENQKKGPPKQEWAYLNFVQGYVHKFPKSKKPEIMEAWKKTREEKVQRVNTILQQYIECRSSKI